MAVIESFKVLEAGNKFFIEIIKFIVFKLNYFMPDR